ncbi:Nn.00g055650.m01.CDS01 [Neocucurbitaria sp. VM-36]
MAAPASIDIKNLQGKWVMNKTLSDAFDPVLSLQGIGWLTRKALGAATVTQHLSQSPTTGENGQPTTEITINQLVTGGLKGSTEKRTMDWHYRGHSDWLFGTLQGRSRYTTLANILEESKGKGVVEEDAKFIVEGWLKETEEGEVVESFVDNEGNKWTGWQIWGFAEINGERMLTRRFAIRRKDKNEVVRVRLVYDYAGTL